MTDEERRERAEKRALAMIAYAPPVIFAAFLMMAVIAAAVTAYFNVCR